MSEKMAVWQYTRELTFPARLAGRSAGEVRRESNFFEKILWSVTFRSARAQLSLSLASDSSRFLSRIRTLRSRLAAVLCRTENAAQCAYQIDEAKNHPRM